MQKTNAVIDTLRWFQEPRLLAPREAEIVAAVGDPSFEFSDAFTLADSIHVHVKVADVAHLPVEKFAGIGGVFDNGHEGYVKYRFPDGLNMIFSSIPIAQDDYAAEVDENRRAYPFVDHIGIDLRQETERVRDAFARLPVKAQQLGWGHIPQGGKTRPVYCCHIEVAAKHWIYPSAANASGIPLEFAFGTLKFNDFKAGCDLRPSSPVLVGA